MVNPRQLLDRGECVVETSDPREALKCGCHSYQSDFKGSLVGPCEISIVNETVYATGNLTNSIIELNPQTGESVHHRVPTARSVPMGMSNNGTHLWFVEFLGGKIGRFNTQNKSFTEYPITPSGLRSGPVSISIDEQNIVWFTAMIGNYLGRLENGEIQKIDLPATRRGPVGPRGLEALQDRVIVASNGANELLSISKETGEIQQSAEFDVANGNPIDVSVDIQQNIAYVTLGLGDGVGMVDLNNMEILQIFNLGEGSRPSRLDIDSSGNVWATEIIDNQLSFINPQVDTIRGTDAPLPLSSPEGIHVDHQDNIWFVMWAADSIAKFNPSDDMFNVFHIKGHPQVIADRNIISVIHDQLQQNRQQAETLINQPLRTPDLNLMDRILSSNIIQGIDAVQSALQVYATTGDDRQTVQTLIDNLPQRKEQETNDRVIIGYSGWVNILNIIITFGLIGTIDRWLSLIISIIRGWIQHELDP